MRITIDLSDRLLSDAMKLTHTETKTDVIVLALKELIRKSKIADLKNYKSKFDLEINVNELRDRG